jgi:hypothetical protein
MTTITNEYKLAVLSRYSGYPKTRKKADINPYKYLNMVLASLKSMGNKMKPSYFPFRELVIDDFEAGLTPTQSAARFYAEWN